MIGECSFATVMTLHSSTGRGALPCSRRCVLCSACTLPAPLPPAARPAEAHPGGQRAGRAAAAGPGTALPGRPPPLLPHPRLRVLAGERPQARQAPRALGPSSRHAAAASARTPAHAPAKEAANCLQCPRLPAPPLPRSLFSACLRTASTSASPLCLCQLSTLSRFLPCPCAPCQVFTYKWSVNWQFLPEPAFLSRQLALALLFLHFRLLWSLAQRSWCAAARLPAPGTPLPALQALFAHASARQLYVRTRCGLYCASEVQMLQPFCPSN